MASSPEESDRRAGLPKEAVPAEEFLRCVVRSGLLEREELLTLIKGVPRPLRTDSFLLADHLVRKGKLTRFQSNKLLRGISLGMILGPFRVLAPVGKGGMSKVFLARDTRSGQLVALKILPPRLARAKQRLVERFRREMEMSQRVSHPHLAWTFEVGEFRTVPYIAMEYIPGRTLSHLVNTDGPMPLPRVVKLMVGVASALEHAHGQGLVHRDLKPSNIIVAARDHAKVVDLGLALMPGEDVTDNTVVGGGGYIVGTMDYISPEQTYDAVGVDGRADLYSLGCTMYFALTGRPPFPGGTSKEKILKHRREIPTPLATLVPGLPAYAVTLVERMMHKNAIYRPATALEVELELRSWLATPAESPTETVSDWACDESEILRREPGSAEFSQYSLPEIEVSEVRRDVAEGGWPAWLLVLLGMGVGLLVVVLYFVVRVLGKSAP